MSNIDNGVGDNLLSIFGKISLQLGDVAKHMKNGMKLQKLANQSTFPTFSKRTFVGVANSGGVTVLGNEGPSSGYFWYIRKVTVGGLTVGTSVTGRTDTFISASAFFNDPRILSGGLTTVSIQDWQDYSTTIPNNAFYGRGEMTLRYPEKFQLVFSGLTAGQQAVAIITFEQFQEAALRQDFEL